ncbi:MAG TPA: copper amine oxidase N-terminal domain-containing protein, partial [Candidatus Baltobacteraceae bacterium]
HRPNWITLSVTAALALAASLTMAFSRPVEVSVDGQRLISDVPPVSTTHDRVYVALRPLDDALGALTRYDEQSGRVAVIRGDQTLRLRVGDTHATLNGMPMTLKHAPFRVRGRVMVNIRTIARAFGVHLKFDKRTAHVDVQTPGVIEAGTQPDTP